MYLKYFIQKLSKFYYENADNNPKIEVACLVGDQVKLVNPEFTTKIINDEMSIILTVRDRTVPILKSALESFKKDSDDLVELRQKFKDSINSQQPLYDKNGIELKIITLGNSLLNIGVEEKLTKKRYRLSMSEIYKKHDNS